MYFRNVLTSDLFRVVMFFTRHVPICGFLRKCLARCVVWRFVMRSRNHSNREHTRSSTFTAQSTRMCTCGYTYLVYLVAFYIGINFYCICHMNASCYYMFIYVYMMYWGKSMYICVPINL